MKVFLMSNVAMAKQIFLLCWVIGFVFPAFATGSIGFKASINRLQMPVQVGDVLKGEIPLQQRTKHWPESLQGWVTRGQISQALAFDVKHWQGVKKAWVEWCYPLRLSAYQAVLTQTVKAGIDDYLTLDALSLESAVQGAQTEQTICTQSKVERLSATLMLPVKADKVTLMLQLFTQHNVEKQRITLPAQFSANALQLNEFAKKGTPLTQLAWRSVNQPWRGEDLLTQSELSQRKLKKTLPENALLTLRNTEVMPLVEQGQVVKVRLQHGAIRIETQAHAMGDAELGEEVSIKVEDSPKISKGTVVAKGVVNVSV